MNQQANNKNYTENRIKVDFSQGGKFPPQAVDLEEAVLGAMLIEREGLLNVIDFLSADSFYDPKHQIIYQAIKDCYAKNIAVDLLTVKTELNNSNKLQDIGGLPYLAQLTQRINSSANITYHAHIVQEKYLRRQHIKQCSEWIKNSYEEGENDVFANIENNIEALIDLTNFDTQKKSKTVLQATSDALNALQERMILAKSGKIPGVTSGFKAIDKITKGWQKGNLYIVAGRPAMGKTAYVTQLVLNAADAGNVVAFFELEMSTEQVMNRIISNVSRIEHDYVSSGELTDHQLQQIVHSTEKLVTQNNIQIKDTPAVTVSAIRAESVRIKRDKGKVDLIIVDYIQLMTGDTNNGTGNREQEISSISRGLKALAKDLDVPVIALSQLSRAVESRAIKKPQLSDLRESGAIEQDADFVGFLYRPEYYNITQTDEGIPTKNMCEFIVAKNRHGKLDTILMTFLGAYSAFTNFLEDDNYPIEKYDKAFQQIKTADDF